MKILYVAKHGSGGNDDEGAIVFSLKQLGNEVICLSEDNGTAHAVARMEKPNFCLFHKWGRFHTLRKVRRCVPCVFWYFDLVSYQDNLLNGRNAARTSWMGNVIDLVDIGFCTDGDWVVTDRTGKLTRLTQGVDPRHGVEFRPHCCAQKDDGYARDLLFTGISKGGGSSRESFVCWSNSRYGDRLKHISTGCHGEALVDVINESRIVLAPDSPVTDRYWSNRVFLTTGYGGFLLHPVCATLDQFYTADELVLYHGRSDLEDKVEYYLTHDTEREDIRYRGWMRTRRDHTYLNRCQQLLDVVREKLCLKNT